MPSPDSPVESPAHRYHDGTKHHVNRFARSLGFLDWASQPRPFRSFDGAPRLPLFPSPGAEAGGPLPPVSYGALFDPSLRPSTCSAAVVGDILRHALGLSAWKVFGASRWSLRVNPSSGNLHPTEAYVVCGGVPNPAAPPAVYHYAADAHALERRCRIAPEDWSALCGGQDVMLVALTSIHWREAWKYGERAFRYCQHDLGHAIGAVATAARMHGWRSTLVPAWPHADIATLTGIDRDQDFADAEREEPACLMALVPEGTEVPRSLSQGPGPLLEAIGRGSWSGRASQLSQDHVEWTFIDEVAIATRDLGRLVLDSRSPTAGEHTPTRAVPRSGDALDARALALQRRSAVAFDGLSRISADAVFAMLSRLRPETGAPWDVLWWTPRVHLLLFVHRVDGLAPGLYVFGRQREGFAALRAAIGRQMLDESAHDTLPLVCLARGDCRAMARRLSCDQDIASEGFFSLGMIAEFDAGLAQHGEAFYRHLFWETGLVGQMLYLEAEAAGVRATGIGCFYDDMVHEAIGLTGHAFQSLYHFTVGAPVEDSRLTTEPGYAWERT